MKVRSLFWTIFITIVSVNLALIVANAYWLGVQLEKRNVKARFSEKLDEHLVRLIDEYEDNKIEKINEQLIARIEMIEKKQLSSSWMWLIIFLLILILLTKH